MQGAHYFGSFSIVVIIAAVITGAVFLFTGIRQKRVRNLPIIICSLFVLAGAVGADVYKRQVLCCFQRPHRAEGAALYDRQNNKIR